MKLKKFISIILTVSTILAMSTSVLAGGYIITPTPSAPGGIGGIVGGLLGLVKAAGIGIAVGMLIYLGIKYTMASANEKADLKNSSIRYVIGALILFSFSVVWGIVQTLVSQILAGGVQE